MSYGTILGQTPDVPQIDLTAQNVTYANSAYPSVIPGTNVQDALDDVAGYTRTNRNNISSLQTTVSNLSSTVSGLSSLFQNYYAIGYLHNYLDNQSIGSTNTLVTRNVSWTSRPSSYPDLVLIGLCDNRYEITEFNVPGNVQCLVITGPDVDDLNNNTPLNPGGYYLSTTYTNCPLNGGPDLKNANPTQYKPFRFGWDSDLNKKSPSMYNLALYTLCGTSTVSSFCGYNPCVTWATGKYYIGGFNWTLSTFTYGLRFSELEYTAVGLMVLALKKRNS